MYTLSERVAPEACYSIITQCPFSLGLRQSPSSDQIDFVSITADGVILINVPEEEETGTSELTLEYYNLYDDSQNTQHTVALSITV